jgi:hypothetical protein
MWPRFALNLNLGKRKKSRTLFLTLPSCAMTGAPAFPHDFNIFEVGFVPSDYGYECASKKVKVETGQYLNVQMDRMIDALTS